MSGRAVRILLGLAVLVLSFVAYELAGLDPKLPGVHTISYVAQNDHWLAWVIGATFPLAGAAGWVWWHWHLSRRITK